jgi:hypothetical protein
MVQLQPPQQIADRVHRANHVCRRASALLIALGAPLFAGACAHNVADTPALQWRLDAAETDTADAANTAQAAAPDRSAEAAPATACGQPGQPGWSDRCYVYRGGRDPKTGLAYTQL